MTAASSAPRRRNRSSTAAPSLNGRVAVNSASAGGTPGLSGSPSVATPLPAFTRTAAACPGGAVVDGRGPGQLGQRGGDARTIGKPQCGHAAPRLHEEAVGVPVVAALE